MMPILLTFTLSLTAVAARQFDDSLFVLPPMLYATEGWEGNVYFDNLAPSRYLNFEWEVLIAKDPNASQHDMGDSIIGTAMQQDERLTWKPAASTSTRVNISVLDPDTADRIASRATTLVATNTSAGHGKTATMLVIGDSLTASGEHTQILLDVVNNSQANDNLKLKLVGTRGQSATNRHEGRGGWTVQDYAEETVGGRPSGFFKVSGVVMPPGGSPATSAPEERYAMASTGGAWTIWDVAISPNGSGTLGAVCYSGDCSVPSSGGQLVKQVATAQGDVNVTFSSFSPGSVNPFWHNGKLDVGAYLALNHLPTPDFATIMLGDNDLSGAQTDSRADEDIGAMLPRLTKLVDALHAGGVGTVGLVLQPPPAYDQDAFGFNYGTTLHRLRMKRAMLKWWAAQIRLAADMDSRSSSVGRRVVIVPVGLNLDTQHNMARTQMAVNARNPAVTVTRTTNGVHPSMAGQGQIADAFFAWLKYESR